MTQQTHNIELTHEELMTALRALDRDTWRLGDTAHDHESNSAAERAAAAVESDAVRAVRVKMAQHIRTNRLGNLVVS
jgi:hypothetical protein